MDTQNSTTSPDKTPERWLPIEGFPGYEVSDLGRVRSYWRKVSRGNLEIRALATHGNLQQDIAEIYGVARGTVSDITLHRTWKHI